MNAQVKRFFWSLGAECADGMIFFGQNMLCRTIGQFVEHYHVERNHQGLGNRLIEAGDTVGHPLGQVKCRKRLGGLLQCYYRDAA